MQVQIFSTAGCAACAAAKRMIERLTADYPDLAVEEIDVAEQPEVAVQHGLLSVPGIVIEGKLVASGHVSEAQLRDKIEQHGRWRS